MRLAVSTWPEIESYLKKNRSLILPVGSTEQHGPTGLIGTDYLCADAVARKASELLDMCVAPPLCYGVSSHHMGFAGSATVRPSVYQAFVAELLRGYYEQGFRRFYLVNGHGGNEPSLKAVFQELKHEGAEGASFHFFNWWTLPEVARLAHELFGDREGHHATPTEVSLSFFTEQIEAREFTYEEPTCVAPFPLNKSEMRKVYRSGTMSSDPGLARPRFGKRILEVAADAVVRCVKEAPVLE